MLNKNKTTEIIKLLIVLIVCFILLIMFKNKIKTFGIVSFSIGLFASLFSTLITENNKKRGLYAFLIFLIVSSLSYYFDNLIDNNLGHADENIIGHMGLINNEKNDSDNKLEKNLVPIDVTKEITTSVSFSTPTQIENELQNQEVYVPTIDEEILESICFLKGIFRADIPDIKEYTSKLVDVVKEKVESYIHTEEGYPVESLNSNKEIGKLVQQALEIDKLLKKEYTVENHKKLIDIYSQAFTIASCSSISLQLSRPYEEIILIHPRNNYEDCNQIFVYGAKGIEYFIQTLSYQTINHSTDSDILYRIAKIYHYLGDLPNLKLEIRSELYQIACAYYELSILYQSDNDLYNIHKPYYCAMVYHKLGVISDQNNYFYLDRALKFYDQSLSYKSISNSMYSDSNKFAAEVCNRLINYTTKYGQNEYINSKEFYEELANEYRSKVRY